MQLFFFRFFRRRGNPKQAEKGENETPSWESFTVQSQGRSELSIEWFTAPLNRRAEKRAGKTPKVAIEFGTRRSQASSTATIAPRVMQQVCPQLHPPKDGTIRRQLVTSVLNYNAVVSDQPKKTQLRWEYSVERDRDIVSPQLRF